MRGALAPQSPVSAPVDYVDARAVKEGLLNFRDGEWMYEPSAERGVLVQPAAQRWNVLKLDPPLTIDEAQTDTLANVVIEVLEDFRQPARTLADVARRVGRQWSQGWAY